MAISVALVILSLMFGCSGEPANTTDVRLIPASGRVMVDDRPLPEATVTLKPIFPWPDENLPYPHAMTDENGQFRLGTFADDDGAPAGSYHVAVTLPSTEGLAAFADPIGRNYADPARSGLTLTVAADSATLPEIKLKGRKPRIPGQSKPSKR